MALVDDSGVFFTAAAAAVFTASFDPAAAVFTGCFNPAAAVFTSSVFTWSVDATSTTTTLLLSV
jgi:hypothetical protein